MKDENFDSLMSLSDNTSLHDKDIKTSEENVHNQKNLKNSNQKPKTKKVYNNKTSSEDESESMSSESLSEEIIPAVKEIKFRNSRGQKIQQLINQQELNNEIDDFWAENKYFGKAEEMDKEVNDDEDFVETESSVEDVFDTDFGEQWQEEIEKDNNENNEEELEILQQERKQKQKSQKYAFKEPQFLLKKRKFKPSDKIMTYNQQQKTGLYQGRKDAKKVIIFEDIGDSRRVKTKIIEPSFEEDEEQQQRGGKKQKIILSKKELKRIEKEKLRQAKYIHNVMDQKSLLQEAVITEYLNKQSLEDLIKYEEEQKKYTIKKKLQITGPNRIKLIDSIKNGNREQCIYMGTEFLVYKCFPQLDRNKLIQKHQLSNVVMSQEYQKKDKDSIKTKQLFSDNGNVQIIINDMNDSENNNIQSCQKKQIRIQFNINKKIHKSDSQLNISNQKKDEVGSIQLDQIQSYHKIGEELQQQNQNSIMGQSLAYDNDQNIKNENDQKFQEQQTIDIEVSRDQSDIKNKEEENTEQQQLKIKEEQELDNMQNENFQVQENKRKYVKKPKPEGFVEYQKILDNQQDISLKFKYRDPKTKLLFNSIQEFQEIRKKYLKEEYKQISQKMKHVQELLMKKTEILEDLQNQNSQFTNI